MRWIDRGLAGLLILGGVGHTYGVLNFYKDPNTLFWSLTASVLIALLAAVNLLRSWRDDRALAAIAAAGSAAYFVIALGFGRLIGDMTDFRVILFGVISLGLTLFGLRDAIRTTHASQ
jgi:peptidoglycan/LPS O-acetylase OafA/YrhL